MANRNNHALSSSLATLTLVGIMGLTGICAYSRLKTETNFQKDQSLQIIEKEKIARRLGSYAPDIQQEFISLEGRRKDFIQYIKLFIPNYTP
jgi:hypothetical protein